MKLYQNFDCQKSPGGRSRIGFKRYRRSTCSVLGGGGGRPHHRNQRVEVVQKIRKELLLDEGGDAP